MKIKHNPTDPQLLALLERARDHKMTPAEIDAQRRSWVRGEMMLDHPEQADEALRKAMGPSLAEQLATARTEARNAALEEAAKVLRKERARPLADPAPGERRRKPSADFKAGRYEALKSAGRAIRALIGTGAQREEG